MSNENDPARANVSAIFSGWPAKYADITRGFTFDRTVASEISHHFLNTTKLCAILLGASGVGKTSAARQAVLRLRKEGFFACEHKQDHSISSDNLLALALRLKLKIKPASFLLMKHTITFLN